MYDLAEYCEELQTICNIDSGSTDAAGVNKVADFFEKEYRRLGWNVRRETISPFAGDYLVITNCPDENYDVLISGHMDTVFPKGEAEKRPVYFEHDIAYGPGVYDMKGADLAVLWAMRKLPEEVNQKLKICIALSPDEEISSRYSRELTKKLAARSSLALVFEGTDVDGLYTDTRCGQRKYEIEFNGIPAHSGYLFERPNASAVVEMARWITEISSLSSKEKHTMVNVGLVSGGTAPNIVPEKARIVVDVRAIRTEEFSRIENVLEYLKNSISVNGVTVSYECPISTPPMFPTDKTKSYLDQFREVFRKIGEPFAVKDVRCGCSDGNFISSTGTPCIDTLGPCGGNSHTEKEYLLLGQVLKCIKRLHAILQSLADSSVKTTL